MWQNEIDRLAVGVKLRRFEDDSIWEVTKRLDASHWEISYTKKNGKKIIQTLSNNSTGFSLVTNHYDFETTIKIRIYADTVEKAIPLLPSEFRDEDDNREGTDWVLKDKFEV